MPCGTVWNRSACDCTRIKPGSCTAKTEAAWLARAHGVHLSRLHFPGQGMRTRPGDVFTGFGPAASKDAIKKMNEQVKSWRLHRLTGHTIGEIAKEINPEIRAGCSTTEDFTSPSCIRSYTALVIT
jgi:hypothetical protein